MRYARRKRLNAIRDAILRDRISSQENLRKALEKKGIYISQATLSRDLQEMGIVKNRVESNSFYSIPVSNYGATVSGSAAARDIELCGNIVVIRTSPGHASMLAALLDSKRIPEIAGTVAGDDTIFAVMRPDADAENCIKAINSVIM